MKYIKIYEDYRDTEIDAICMEYEIENYTINSDGSIDVNGDVHLYNMILTEIPLKFGKVTGSFNCSSNYLTSLKGSPTEVGVSFDCSYNKLTSLEHCPTKTKHFRCNDNNLTSLEYSPK